MTGFFDYETCEPLRVWDRLEPRSREVDFDSALEESGASVTEEMLSEYDHIRHTLKSDAVRPNGIGFVLPGMLRPRGGEKGGLEESSSDRREPGEE